jgi:hypothetical protein
MKIKTNEFKTLQYLDFVLNSVVLPWCTAVVHTLIGSLIALLSTLGIPLITEHVKRTQDLKSIAAVLARDLAGILALWKAGVGHQAYRSNATW